MEAGKARGHEMVFLNVQQANMKFDAFKSVKTTFVYKNLSRKLMDKTYAVLL